MNHDFTDENEQYEIKTLEIHLSLIMVLKKNELLATYIRDV